MKRRSFLATTSLIAAGSALSLRPQAVLAQNASEAAEEKEGGSSGSQSLQFFIISDAHFGWRYSYAPTVAEFDRNMKHVLDRFPDLDFFVDSGDAHHSNAEVSAIEDWTRVVQSKLGSKPLHFVAGNHEVDVWGRDWDPEEHACRLASIPARPYYSFDVKGIHFLVLPQMIMASYVTEEALAWAKLDLALNRHKTTIVLSHNSLKGTTGFQTDLGYRQTINSDEMLELIANNKQIVAWMHGHNHTYELVPLDGIAYVSNGRFGGFNPEPLDIDAPEYESPSNSNLGGFYVNVSRRQVEIRAYNVSLKKWFDEIPGQEFLHWKKTGPTTFDPQAAPAVSYGHGRIHHGIKHAVHRHYAGPSVDRHVYITGAPNAILNENSDFRHYTQRTLPDWQTKHLPGFVIRPIEETENKFDPSWTWLNPGLRLEAKERPNQPKMVMCPNPGQGRRSYFRCVPGATYELTLEVDAGPGGQEIEIFAEVCSDVNREVLGRIDGVKENLKEGKSVYTVLFTVPEEYKSGTRYAGASEGSLQLMSTARFASLLAPVDLYKFELRLAKATEKTREPLVTIGESEFGLRGILQEGQVASLQLPPRQDAHEILEIEAKGNGQLCVLIREEGNLWQVRNAHGRWQRGSLEVSDVRNPFSADKEVILAPIYRYTHPFVSKVRGADDFRVTPFTRATPKIIAEVGKADGNVEIELIAPQKPTVIGGELASHADGRAVIKAKPNSKVEVSFS